MRNRGVVLTMMMLAGPAMAGSNDGVSSSYVGLLYDSPGAVTGRLMMAFAPKGILGPSGGGYFDLDA